MIAPIENVEAGFCLTNIADPRFRYITSLKRRFGIFLHSASVNLRLQSEENVVDVVDMLVSAGSRFFSRVSCGLDQSCADLYVGIRRKQGQV